MIANDNTRSPHYNTSSLYPSVVPKHIQGIRRRARPYAEPIVTISKYAISRSISNKNGRNITA